MGLYSFMQEETPTFGSITTSDAERRKFAKDSLYFNLKNKYDLTYYFPIFNIVLILMRIYRNFCELFPELVELAAQKRKVRGIQYVPIEV